MAAKPSSTPRKQRPRAPIGLSPTRRGRPVKQLAFWVVLFLILLLSFQHYYYGKPRHEDISYSQFIQEVDNGNILGLVFIDKAVEGEFQRDRQLQVGGVTKPVRFFRTTLPFEDPALLQRVTDHNPKANLDAKRPQANWLGVLASGLPFLLLIVFWLFLM